MNTDTQINIDVVLQKIMSDNNVIVLSTMEEINNIFEIKTLNDDVPNIRTDKNSLLIFDTADTNSCYLLEELNKLFDVMANPEIYNEFFKMKIGADDSIKKVLLDKVFEVIDNTQIYYCTNKKTQEELFLPFYQDKTISVRPAILMINHKVKAIFNNIESLMPFDLTTFLEAYLIISDAEKINQKYDIENPVTSK